MKIVLLIFLMVSCFTKNKDSSLEVSKKEHLYKCKKDSDCLLLDQGCCNCNHGGQRISMHYLEVAEQKPKNCALTMCAAMISNHASCRKQAKSVCSEGVCAINSGTGD
jgi:hypothetical protein